MTRVAWSVAAVVAGGVLVAVGLHGERPTAGLSRYEPAGVMVAIPAERVRSVEIASGTRRLRFVRAASGWTGGDGSPVPRPVADDLETGVRLLHGSAPQRVMSREELGGTPLAELGLAPPRLVVSAFSDGEAPFVVEIGGPNPQGLARYARVSGREEIVLLNRYVAEAWERAATH